MLPFCQRLLQANCRIHNIYIYIHYTYCYILIPGLTSLELQSQKKTPPIFVFQVFLQNRYVLWGWTEWSATWGKHGLSVCPFSRITKISPRTQENPQEETRSDRTDPNRSNRPSRKDVDCNSFSLAQGLVEATQSVCPQLWKTNTRKNTIPSHPKQSAYMFDHVCMWSKLTAPGSHTCTWSHCLYVFMFDLVWSCVYDIIWSSNLVGFPIYSHPDAGPTSRSSGGYVLLTVGVGSISNDPGSSVWQGLQGRARSSERNQHGKWKTTCLQRKLIIQVESLSTSMVHDDSSDRDCRKDPGGFLVESLSRKPQ